MSWFLKVFSQINTFAQHELRTLPPEYYKVTLPASTWQAPNLCPNSMEIRFRGYFTLVIDLLLGNGNMVKDNNLTEIHISLPYVPVRRKGWQALAFV